MNENALYPAGRKITLDLPNKAAVWLHRYHGSSLKTVALRPGDLWFCCSESSYAQSALQAKRSILADS